MKICRLQKKVVRQIDDAEAQDPVFCYELFPQLIGIEKILKLLRRRERELLLRRFQL